MTISATFTGPTADGTGFVFAFDKDGAPYGEMTAYTTTQAQAEASADLQCQNLGVVVAPAPQTG